MATGETAHAVPSMVKSEDVSMQGGHWVGI